MIVRLSHSADAHYNDLPAKLRKVCDKQLRYLVRDLRHPSLHAKKYDEGSGLWQARINASWRFYFFIQTGAYFVVSIRKHPK